jgi:hypothetical protein
MSETISVFQRLAKKNNWKKVNYRYKALCKPVQESTQLDIEMSTKNYKHFVNNVSKTVGKLVFTADKIVGSGFQRHWKNGFRSKNFDKIGEKTGRGTKQMLKGSVDGLG